MPFPMASCLIWCSVQALSGRCWWRKSPACNPQSLWRRAVHWVAMMPLELKGLKEAVEGAVTTESTPSCQVHLLQNK